jgi:hypothetical protein
MPVDRHPLLEAACAGELAAAAAKAAKAVGSGAARAVTATQGGNGSTEMRVAAETYT